MLKRGQVREDGRKREKKKMYTILQTQVMKVFWKRLKLGGFCSLRIQRGDLESVEEVF